MALGLLDVEPTALPEPELLVEDDFIVELAGAVAVVCVFGGIIFDMANDILEPKLTVG